MRWSRAHCRQPCLLLRCFVGMSSTVFQHIMTVPTLLPCSPRNKHIMIDLGTGNNNKINWAMNDKQEFIDIVETIYRGARKGRGLVVSPKDYSTKYRWVLVLASHAVSCRTIGESQAGSPRSACMVCCRHRRADMLNLRGSCEKNIWPPPRATFTQVLSLRCGGDWGQICSSCSKCAAVPGTHLLMIDCVAEVMSVFLLNWSVLRRWACWLSGPGAPCSRL